MESLIPHNALAFTITGLLLLILAFKTVIDTKEVRAAKRQRDLVWGYVRKKHVPGISLFIELRRTAETILPLLDDLYAQEYPRLEVIVVVKHTAGKFAAGKLAYYRRKHRRNLKVVKHTKGMTTQDVVRRYAVNPLVMQLPADSTLPRGFFAEAALAFLDDRFDAVIPRYHVRLNQTLLSAFHAVCMVWRHPIAAMRAPQALENKLDTGVVYRRKLLAKRTELRPSYSHRLAVHYAPVRSWRTLSHIVAARLRNKNARLAATILVTLVAGFTAVLWNQDIALLGEFLLLSYWVVCGLLVLGTAGYSWLERISLVLFAPFSPVLMIVVLCHAALSGLYTRKRSTRKSAQPKPLSL